MISSLLSKFFGNKSSKDMKRLVPQIEKINQEYNTLTSLSDQEIVDKYQSLKQILSKNIASSWRKTILLT